MAELEEKIRALRLLYGHKHELLRLLSSEFGLALPMTAPYARIIRELTEAGVERKFCQRVFHTNSLDEGVSVLSLRLGLETLPWDTLKDLAQVLSDDERKWTYPKARNRDIIDTIVRNCPKDEVDEAIYRLIEDNRLEPVQQYQEWVVGPLGIAESVSKRGAASSDSLVSFLVNHVDVSICEEIVELSGFIPPTKLEPSLVQAKIIQLLLSYGTDKDILRLFNHLLDTGKIRIGTREDYWDFFATPAGVFEYTYEDPIAKLADLLVFNLNEETLRKEFRIKDKDLRLQIVRQCLTEKPDEILDRLFGMPDLRRIARDLGLVAIDSVSEKRALIDFLLLRLGFKVPKTPQGMAAVRAAVETNLGDLETLDMPSKIGMVTGAYVQLEKLLKDLVFFYVSVLWRDEIEYADLDELEILNDFIRTRFLLRKPVGRLSFGELVGLLERIDEKAVQGEKQRNVISHYLGRTNLLMQQEKDLLRGLSARRKRFAHHVAAVVRPEECANTLNEILELLRGLRNTMLYPRLVLIINEVTNEYGIRFLKGVDEEGLTWTIKSDEYWLSSAQHCFLLTETLGIAINPIIVRRFWEPGS